MNTACELLIGMDEAGLGPNLGPLVVTATRWEVPGKASQCDLLSLLRDCVSGQSTCKGTRLHIADSKAVYSTAAGLGSLEQSALALLGTAGCNARSLGELLSWLQGARLETCGLAGEAWHPEFDLPLPLAADADEVQQWVGRLRKSMESQQVRLTSLRSQVVFPRRFNQLIDELDNKSLLLSTVTFELLGEVWNAADDRRALVIGDKHGGRNRYDDLLCDLAGEAFIFRLEEGRQRSCYRIGNAELRFQVGGEEHFPVAAASIISKYVRELTMEAFNRFWSSHLPDIRPTKGYPQDARRFREQVEEQRLALEIAEDDFWRSR